MSDIKGRADADRKYAGVAALLILAVGLFFILVSTLKPFDFEFRRLTATEYFTSYEIPPSSILDFPRNILLFVPFGFGLAAFLEQRGWSAHRIRLLVPTGGFLLTLTVESLQMFLPFRQPSVADLVANTLGTAAGLVCFRLWQNRDAATVWLREKMSSPQHVLAVLAIYAFTLMLIAYGLSTSTLFFEWDSDYKMMLGNERTGDRQWHGSVQNLQLFNRAFDANEARRLLGNHDQTPVGDEGLLASYPLSGGRIEQDTTGQQPDLIWQAAQVPGTRDGFVQFDGGWLQTESAVADLSENLQATSQLTIRLTAATADLDQHGPARIISISDDPLLRNLTFGQEGGDLVMRYRSLLTGENGTTPQILFTNFFDDLDPVEFIVSFDGLDIELIDLRSRTVQSVELVPGVAFFYTFVHPIFSASPSLGQVTAGTFSNWVFRLFYYTAVFLPLGMLIALPRLKNWDRKFRTVLVLGSLLVVPILMELMLVMPSGHGPRLLNVATGILICLTVTGLCMLVVHRLSTRQ
jgi:glycopeptide antibiotics resistance protein